MNMLKVKTIAGILAVFLLGVIIGILGTGIFIRHSFRHFGEDEHSFRKVFMQRLTRELKLTEAQKPEVEKIVGDTEAEMHTLFQNSLTEFAKIMQSRNAKLKTVLTPEQQKKLDEIQEQMQKHWRARPFKNNV